MRHHAPAALEQVSAAIRLFHLAAHRVCQCHLGDLAREIRALGGPIAKRRTEAVGGEIIAFHSAQQHQEGHVAQRLTAFATREHVRFSRLVCVFTSGARIAEPFHLLENGDRPSAQHALPNSCSIRAWRRSSARAMSEAGSRASSTSRLMRAEASSALGGLRAIVPDQDFAEIYDQ
jgi:hypothetical protein